MKIVVLDGYTENPGDLSWDEIRSFGETIIFDRTPYDDAVIISRIGDADVVITNKTYINENILSHCPEIKFIAVLATGFNVIDLDACSRRGIPVSNVPAYGTDAVGQAAIALLLEICNGVGHHSQAVHEGRWESNCDWCFWDHPIIELSGKTMGIIGFGRIGQATGRIAKAMGMKVLAFNRSESEAGRAIAEYVSLEELLSRSDVIALHAPMAPNIAGIINKDTIAQMKDGVILLNNSRGGLVVEQDLADALNSGKVYAAGIDVVSTEPIRSDNPLLTAKNCFITPHISWAAVECRQRIMDMTAQNIQAWLNGAPIHVVNPFKA